VIGLAVIGSGDRTRTVDSYAMKLDESLKIPVDRIVQVQVTFLAAYESQSHHNLIVLNRFLLENPHSLQQRC